MDYNIAKITIIQRFFRNVLLNINIISSEFQTKQWRKNQLWYNNGKSNECEKYQIRMIEKIIHTSMNKTYDRIHFETHSIVKNTNPNIYDDGYEWSETFDSKVVKNNKIFYFNLKFICDSGGSQTRTLRDVYHFIKHQLIFLQEKKTNNIYFINILDGDCCYKNINKFHYIINKDVFYNKYIFIGSLYEFYKSKFIRF